MLYQVNTTLFFQEEDEAEDFKQDCLTAMAKSVLVNPGEPHQEHGFVHLLECHHDNFPTAPCRVLFATSNLP